MSHGIYRRIAVAVSLSPRREALIAEAHAWAVYFGAELLVIHIGPTSEHVQCHLEALMERHHYDEARTRLIYAPGNRVEAITNLCAAEQVDLLICGAMPRRSLTDIFWGSVAKRLVKYSPCAILILPRPLTAPRHIRQVAIGTLEEQAAPSLVERGVRAAGSLMAARVHILHQAGLEPLALAAAADSSAGQMHRIKRELVIAERAQVAHWLEPFAATGDDYDDQAALPEIAIKLVSGRPGPAWTEYLRRHKIQLLVVDAPRPSHLGFFWRMASPHFEHLMTDLPCALLLVK